MRVALAGKGRQGVVRRSAARSFGGCALARRRLAVYLSAHVLPGSQDTHGWNNAVFPNAAMPHALWTLQGERAAGDRHAYREGGDILSLDYNWTQISPGAQNTVQYDATVRDLVNFLVYVGEPAGQSRKHIGAIVLFVLSILFVLAYALKKVYWKDVH
jgi:cytochrome c1